MSESSNLSEYNKEFKSLLKCLNRYNLTPQNYKNCVLRLGEYLMIKYNIWEEEEREENSSIYEVIMNVVKRVEEEKGNRTHMITTMKQLI